MTIRKAVEKDIARILALLDQVWEIHAAIRPDIFVSGTTKYTRDELGVILKDEKRPIYVAVDENDEVCGYAFCELKEPAFTTTMIPAKSLYIDDLCVDEKLRGQNLGKELFEYVKDRARDLGCYEITLAVWEGNDSAEKFYRRLGMKTKETIMEYIL
jgi:ribosomal protein S18 acetylase RimI-like enzyme